jgi:hypothetical protein
MSTVVTRSKPRLIHGIILKCVDGHWKDSDDITPTGEMVVVHTTRALQCWKNQELLDYEIEQPGETLTRDHADELNAPIPKEEWGLGLDNQPRPPWAINWVVYLIDLTAGQRYTYLNSTWGAQVGVEKLEDRMNVQRALRGPGVRPIIKLDSRPMKTKKVRKCDRSSPSSIGGTSLVMVGRCCRCLGKPRCRSNTRTRRQPRSRRLANR